MPAQVFRSPTAIVVWWVWVLFAVGNLIDIAVQGRDHSSLVAAFVLIAVTGVMYVSARRPRLIADDAGLMIVNPLRVYRVGWAAVTAIDAADLIRVRCEWPSEPGGEQRQKVIYAWAAGSSRRRQALARMRAERRTRFPMAAPAGASPAEAEPSDADKIVAALTARADEARAAARSGAVESPATGPVGTWCWPAFAVAGVPVLALLAVLAA